MACYDCISTGTDCGCGYLSWLEAQPDNMDAPLAVWQARAAVTRARMDREREAGPATGMLDEQPPLSAWIDRVGVPAETDVIYLWRTTR